MDNTTARILIDSMLDRLEELPDGKKKWSGPISHQELEALELATDVLANSSPNSSASIEPRKRTLTLPSKRNDTIDEQINLSGQNNQEEYFDEEITENTTEISTSSSIESGLTAVTLNTSCLDLPTPPNNARICIDFGTAMSKATLVHEDQYGELEDVVVLQVGSQGNQNVINENMLVSSVYIADDGLMHFGDAAIEVSNYDAGDSRQRLDNIKRRISEEGIEEKLDERFNPTKYMISHRDVVTAYLMYLTWTINKCTDSEGFPRNIERRFAMPCLSTVKRIEVEELLRGMLGEAQVLSDTFSDDLDAGEGIDIAAYCETLSKLRNTKHQYNFVSRSLTEPLGVAGSLTNWKTDLDQLVMIIDIGAGTSDFSLYRIKVNGENAVKNAYEIEGSSQGITEAGNHLDHILNELIIKKSGIKNDDPSLNSERWKLERDIRENKEALFNDGQLIVALKNGDEVEIELREFLDMSPVKEFSIKLRNKMIDILESISIDFIEWVNANPQRYLTVVLTGGGATLPMVQSLVDSELEVHGKVLRTRKALPFPVWLREENSDLEDDYARIAVSLGGARKNILDQEKSITSHVSDERGKRTLERFQ